MAAEREVTLSFKVSNATEIKEALEQMSKLAKQAGIDMKGLSDKGKEGDSTFKDFVKSAGGFITTVGVGVVGAVTAATATFVGFTIAAANAGGQISDLRNQLAIAAGGTKEMDEATRKLKEATEGQVSGTVLQQALLKTLGGASKVTADQLATLAQAIFTVSKPTGDFESNFNAVVSGLARGNPRALLMIRGFEGLRGAMRDASEAAKKQGVELTAQQETQLLITEALKIAEEQQKKFGSATVTVNDLIERATTTFNSFITEIQVAVTESEPLKRALLTVGDVFVAFGITAKDSGVTVGRVIGELAAQIVEFGIDATVALIEFGSDAGEVFGFILASGSKALLSLQEFAGALGEFWINTFGKMLQASSAVFDFLLVGASKVAGVFDDELKNSIEGIRLGLEFGLDGSIERMKKLRAESQLATQQLLTSAVDTGRAIQTQSNRLDEFADKLREAARLSRERRAREPIAVRVDVTGGRQEAERVGREVGEAVRQEVQGLLTSEELLKQSVDEGLAAALAATGG
jgi:hypothetical protein